MSMDRMLVVLCLAVPGTAMAQFDPAAFEAAQARCDMASMQAQVSAPDGSGPDWLLAVARLDLMRGDTEAAVQRLQAGAERYPQSASIQMALGQALVERVEQVSVFSKLGIARDALSAFRRAADLAPDHPPYLTAVAEYYRQAPGIAGGDLKLARQWAQRLMEVAPQQGRLLLAQIHLDEGDVESGRAQISELAESGFADARMLKAMWLVEEGRLEVAIDEYRQVLQQQPDHLLALYGLGRNAAASGQALDEGRRAMERFLALPGSACQAGNLKRTHGYWRLGNLLARLGDPAAARRAYEQALALDPDNQDARRDLKAL